MNIIILGAGEVGRELAWTLCDKKNRVVVVDNSAPRLERLRERLDVMTLQGEGASVSVLKEAGIDKARLLVAATGSQSTNVLACRVARHYGVQKTICRVTSRHFFAEEDGFTPAAAGIDHLIFPDEECVARVMATMNYRCAVERIALPQTPAEVCAFRVHASSQLIGLRFREFPDTDLLSRIRFALMIRNQHPIVPTGPQQFMLGDEVYAAGSKEDMDQLLELAEPQTPDASLVLVAGATTIGSKLVNALLADGWKVRVIERDGHQARQLMEAVDGKVMVINGDSTEGDVLEDAGVTNCHAFINTVRDDEYNILSCVLAKKLGAGKVVSITNKAEYVDIVPALSAIDCGFSPRLVAVNSVLSLLSTEAVRVHAILQRTHAYVYEFEVRKRSPVADRRIADAIPASTAILSLVFRGDQMIPPTGDLVLQVGDVVVLIARPCDVRNIEPLFRKKHLLPL